MVKSHDSTGTGNGTRGRGTAITQSEELDFLIWLSMTGSVPKAAEFAGGRPRTTWWKRRQRDEGFRRKWEMALEGLRVSEEDFWKFLEEQGIPATAYTDAGLSRSWYDTQMGKNQGFREKVDSTRKRVVSILWKKALDMANEGDGRMVRFCLGAIAPALTSGQKKG